MSIGSTKGTLKDKVQAKIPFITHHTPFIYTLDPLRDEDTAPTSPSLPCRLPVFSQTHTKNRNRAYFDF